MDRFLCHVCEFQNEHTPQEFQSLMIENISQRVQKGIDLLLVNIVKLMKSSKLSFSDKSRGSLNSHHHHTNYFLNYWIHENTFQSRDLLISKICSYISNSLIENNDESFQYMIIKTDDQHSSSELLKEFCELNSTSDPMNHHHNEYFQLLNKLFEHAIDNHAPNWMDQQPLATTSARSASTTATTTTTHHTTPSFYLNTPPTFYLNTPPTPPSFHSLFHLSKIYLHSK
ncbi:hypothetical protein C9374_002713 [Naegleria lovaniensis]|uniref:Uncharacterized protein n=1 Tax=Naegleria lovaniensis TaxID=51637 RepID=A0AA88GSK9_NAELO|nr:uncharacterized protein C9374_002713 [Naegleria lovaniensis]KAG2386267.1 hypothetical protein C9374_002713 [Naegleria lovaniensis]